MNGRLLGLAAVAILLLGAGVYWFAPRRAIPSGPGSAASHDTNRVPAGGHDGSSFIPGMRYRPHALPIDQGGFKAAIFAVQPWKPGATLQEIAEHWGKPGYRGVELVERQLADPKLTRNGRFASLYLKATLLNYEGEAERAYGVLQELRSLVESDRLLAQSALGTVIYLQGVTALRRGENENCLMCQGDSACLLPIAPSAVHTNPIGSRLAIRHFMEYLEQFPDNLEVRWLLNLAHMTLAEYPDKVDARFRLDLSRFFHSEFDIGAFREVSHLVGLGDRMNQSGGAIMDDFDNDGLLDIVVTCHDPTQNMAFYHNEGDGTFADKT